MAVMVVAGGQGVVLGPAVGALVFTFIPELLRMAAFYLNQQLDAVWLAE